MNRAPTMVHPAANEMKLGQNVVLPLPNKADARMSRPWSGADASPTRPYLKRQLGRDAVPTLPMRVIGG